MLPQLETELKIRGFTPATIKAYTTHNRRFLQFIQKAPEQINEADIKLYLAHLIADFVLQVDELYKLKIKGHLGHILHVATYFVVSLVLVIPYLGYPVIWVLLIVATIIHYIQDSIKYSLQSNPKIAFHCFFIDQIGHFLVTALIFLFPVSQVILGFPNYPRLDAFYLSNQWTIFLILYITVTFGGSYLWYNFRKTFVPHTRPDHGITSFEMWHMLLERTLIIFIFLFTSNWLVMLGSPLIGILRLGSSKLRDKWDFLFSFIFTALLGWFFRVWF